MIFLFTKPFAVELSVCTGVGGCISPSSPGVLLVDISALENKNSAQTSTSATDDIIALIILVIFCTAPLFGGNGVLFDVK